MVKLTPEIAEALAAAQGAPITVELPGSDRTFVLIDAESHWAAMEKLAVMEGLADIRDGRTQPLSDVSSEIRSLLKQRQSGGSAG